MAIGIHTSDDGFNPEPESCKFTSVYIVDIDMSDTKNSNIKVKAFLSELKAKKYLKENNNVYHVIRGPCKAIIVNNKAYLIQDEPYDI